MSLVYKSAKTSSGSSTRTSTHASTGSPHPPRAATARHPKGAAFQSQPRLSNESTPKTRVSAGSLKGYDSSLELVEGERSRIHSHLIKFISLLPNKVSFVEDKSHSGFSSSLLANEASRQAISVSSIVSIFWVINYLHHALIS